MPGFFKENWKRLANRWPPRNTASATDPKDVVRVEDMDAALSEIEVGGGGFGSGLFRVTNYTEPTIGYAIGGDEAVMEMHVIHAGGDYDMIMPYNPLIGKRYEVKDGAGDGCYVTKNVVASGDNSIEGVWQSFPLDNCYQSWTLIFQGSGIWRLV